jgi:alpha-1,2-mannosyltransferase
MMKSPHGCVIKLASFFYSMVGRPATLAFPPSAGLVIFRRMLTAFTHVRSRVRANPRLIRIVFLGALALVVLLMSVKYAAKIEKPSDAGIQNRSAFLRWRSMIHDLFTGTNVYIGVHEYPNPPIMAMVLKPFADLPPKVGALTWFYAKVLMAVLSAVWVFRLVSPELPDSAKALTILLALPPLLGDLSHNNVNIFILFLVAGCLEAYRRGWGFTSGLVLALAIACKVTPLMFLAFFIYKHAARTVLGCLAGLALWLAIVPGLAFGWDRNAELLESWYSLMVKPSLVDNRVTSEHPNQSIPGVVFRLLTHSPSYVVYPDNIPTPGEYHNIADIGTDTARTVVKCALVAFALLILVLCRSPRDVRQGPWFAAECSLIVIGMLLFSERTWKHHAVTLLLPYAALAFAISAGAWSPGIRRTLIGILVATACLTNLPGVLPPRPADLAMVYGSYTAAFLCLTLGIAILLLPRWTCSLPDRGTDFGTRSTMAASA